MAAATESTPINGDKATSQVDLSTIPISPEGGASTEKSEDTDKPVTVFHDPENFSVIHPLTNAWTLFFTKPPSGKGTSPFDLNRRVVLIRRASRAHG